MIKKICTTGVIVWLLFFNITFAQNGALTQEDLFNQVKQLQAQIQALQAQIADLKAEVQSVKLELKFSRALSQGATGDDVKQLQEFLKTFTGAYPEGQITGYYGPRTKAAVKNFQTQNGIESVGVVGPKTQEKLNVLAAAIPAIPVASSQVTGILATPATPAIPSIQSGTTVLATTCRTPVGVEPQVSSIKVLSPNGGEEWQIGGTYIIKYSAANLPANKALLVYLEKGYDPPSTKTGANSGLLIGVTTNLESYTYTVPQNIQGFPGLGNNYKITVMVEGSYSSCGVISYNGNSSDATFSIVAGQYTILVAGATQVISPPTNTSPVSTALVSGGGYGQDSRVSALLAQISAVQEKLNSTTDPATRDSLSAQINALKSQLQALQNNVASPVVLPAPSGVTTVLAPVTPPLSVQINQDKINSLYAQITTLQNQLNSTIDTAIRDSLLLQIIALKAQVQSLQNTSATTSATPVTTTGVGGGVPPVQSTPIPETSVSTQNAEDKIAALYDQIYALKAKLNVTTDPAVRDALTSQIAALETQL